VLYLNEDSTDEVSELFFPHDSRLLELQLMHRYSTYTYKSMCTPVSGDTEVWRVRLPSLAITNDFLLSGMLALTAFEAASRTTSLNREHYANAAIQYHAHSLERGRIALSVEFDGSPPLEIVESRLIFSLIVMVLTFASAQFTQTFTTDGDQLGDSNTMLQSTFVHNELVIGCSTVLGDPAQAEAYITSNPHLAKLTMFDHLPSKPLPQHITDILEKLSLLNERRLTRTVAEPLEVRTEQVTRFEACKTAITFLRECFAKCAMVAADEDYSHQGYVLGYLAMAGEPYIQALKKGDNVALVILMYWGALIEKLSWRVWWGAKFGALLVQEIEMRIASSLYGETGQLYREVMDAAKAMIEESAMG
jgi:hypothetical protein